MGRCSFWNLLPALAVYAHRYMSPFWLSYRPVILVYVDGGRNLGNYRH